VTDAVVELETVEPVESAESGQPAPVSDEQLVAMLVERARSEGLQLTGLGGLLQQLTKRVLESATAGSGQHRSRPHPDGAPPHSSHAHAHAPDPSRAPAPARSSP
jgi:hypothetical protein